MGEKDQPPCERYLSPILVLSLHAALVADVAMHRRPMWDLHRALSALEWTLVVCSVTAYLRTVCSDPGFLRREPSKPGWGALACLGLLALLWRGKSANRTERGKGGDGIASARDLRNVVEPGESVPIGRSVLDGIDADAESDPGEETIELADLDGGGTDLRSSAKGSAAPPQPCPPATASSRKKKTCDNIFHPPGTTLGGIDPDDKRRVVLQSGHRLRFCTRCDMHQPLRTKHCRDCGRCVRTHDHHCPWIGTCVGEGNRVYFYWFLLAQTLELAVFLFEGSRGFSRALYSVPIPLIAGMILIALLLLMVSCLLVFHTYLAASNLTTWESISWHSITYLRSNAPENGSPFSRSLCSNLAIYCFAPHCYIRGCKGAPDLKLTDDGWAIWDLGEPHNPAEVDCSALGCDRRCNLLGCFEIV